MDSLRRICSPYALRSYSPRPLTSHESHSVPVRSFFLLFVTRPPFFLSQRRTFAFDKQSSSLRREREGLQCSVVTLKQGNPEARDRLPFLSTGNDCSRPCNRKYVYFRRGNFRDGRATRPCRLRRLRRRPKGASMGRRRGKHRALMRRWLANREREITELRGTFVSRVNIPRLGFDTVGPIRASSAFNPVMV